MGIVHRDLKPENILCVKPDSIKKVKIADFGISKILTNNGNNPNGHLMKTLCGTLTYTAPEILRGKGYDQSVDYWSIGVIMYILLCGYPPFWGETETEISHSILKDSVEFDDDDWKNVSPSLKAIVRSLLSKNSRDRVNPDKVLKVTWKISSKKIQPIPLSKKSRSKFKETVIRRKILRKSTGLFETSSRILNKVYKPQTKPIREQPHNNNNNYNNINKGQSVLSSMDELTIQQKHSQPTKTNRKIDAFRGRRGSKGTEQLFELKLPLSQRDSWMIDDSSAKKIKNRFHK